jgi:hypothetical protein
MPAGYPSAWITWVDALGYIKRVAGCGRDEAIAGLQTALRDGNVASCHADTGAPINAEAWRPGLILIEGKEPLIGSRRPIELRRADIERWWPDHGAQAASAVEAGRGPKRQHRSEKSKPRWPQPGSIGRFVSSDRELFPEIARLKEQEHLSVGEAAAKLAAEGKVAGRGTDQSRSRRLAALYRSENR